MSIPRPHRKRPHFGFGAVLFMIAGMTIWICAAYATPGRINPGDVVGVVVLILAIMRFIQPIPRKDRRND